MFAAPARLLNFVVVGNVRSGTGVIASAISQRDDAVCHADLFHADVDVRRACHEGYFGKCKDPVRLPEWFVVGLTNPWQYIGREVFAAVRHGETAVGVRLLYPDVSQLELFTLFAEKYMEGDFCVLHVDRNPVACLISQKQAEKSGVWRLPRGQEQKFSPLPVWLDADELTQFCRAHMALRQKIRAACPDAMDVNYRDLFFDFQMVMRKVWDFLELEDEDDTPAVSEYVRLKNRHMHDRVSNLAAVRAVVPSDIKQLIDADDLF